MLNVAIASMYAEIQVQTLRQTNVSEIVANLPSPTPLIDFSLCVVDRTCKNGLAETKKREIHQILECLHAERTTDSQFLSRKACKHTNECLYKRLFLDFQRAERYFAYCVWVTIQLMFDCKPINV